MLTIKIIFTICIIIIFICLHAYVSLYRVMRWYKAEYEKYPRYVKRTPRHSWSQKIMSAVTIFSG